VIAGFVRGLSVRDVENTLADALGAEAALSKSTVSRVCQAITAEFEAWSKRRLDDLELDYLFLDASMFTMHPGARAEPVLAAWGITTAGAPVFVALAAGGSESSDAWGDFLDELRTRRRRAAPHRRLRRAVRANLPLGGQVLAVRPGTADQLPALPARTPPPHPALELHRAHLRRDPPPGQGHRSAARRDVLPQPGLGRAQPRLPRLARHDHDTGRHPRPGRASSHSWPATASCTTRPAHPRSATTSWPRVGRRRSGRPARRAPASGLPSGGLPGSARSVRVTGFTAGPATAATWRSPGPRP